METGGNHAQNGRRFVSQEVAREMDISPDTVRGHIKEIFLRLGAKNKGQAVDIFIRAERKARLLDS
ncbi:MAG: LuxR C-terminal-related transcriptional regulator [Gammaproteobacteria bacterium]